MNSQLHTFAVSRRALFAAAAMWAIGLPSRIGATQSARSLAWESVVAVDGVWPGPRWDHVLAADESGRALIIHGGRDGAGTALDDTWRFEIGTGSWSRLQVDGPSARFGAAAAVDPASGGIYLFGGQSADQFFNDTWRFDFEQGTWSLVHDGTGVAPSPRYGLGTVIDDANQLLISHGFTFEGRFDDTWAFDLAAGSWAEISPVETRRPLRRCLHEQVWDATSGQMLLYGGCSSGYGPCPQGDLWTFDPVSGLWTEVTPAAGPEARSNPALVELQEGWGSLMFGGLSAAGYLADAWLLSASEASGWILLEQQGAVPSPRASHDMVILGDDVYLFGGNSPGGALGDLWRGRIA